MIINELKKVTGFYWYAPLKVRKLHWQNFLKRLIGDHISSSDSDTLPAVAAQVSGEPLPRYAGCSDNLLSTVTMWFAWRISREIQSTGTHHTVLNRLACG